MKIRKIIFISLFASLLISCNKSTIPSESIDSGSQNTSPYHFDVNVRDVSLRVGESLSLDYELTPIGFASQHTYTLLETNPSECISLDGDVIKALEVGTASIRLDVFNMEKAKYAFNISKTFKVTVTQPPKEEGEYFLNSSFEYDFYGWELKPDDVNKQYTNFVVNNTTHTGDCALNLWSRSDGATEGISDYLDLEVSQTVKVDKSSTFLYSLWYKGDNDSLTMKVSNEDAIMNEEEFDLTKFSKLVDEGQNGYAQYGIELSLLENTSYSFSFHIETERTSNWGFIDDVSLKEGSLEDLIRPENMGDDEHNFVNNPSFENDLTGLINLGDEVTRATTFGTFVSCYGATGGTYEMYQEVKNLPKLTYKACMSVIGSGEYTAKTTECYFYIADSDGNILYKEDFTIPSYEWHRVAMDNLELEGDVRIGVRVVATSRVYVGFTDFRLFSIGYQYIEKSDTSLTDIKIANKDVVVEENRMYVVLDDGSYENLVASKSDAISFISATLGEKAIIDRAVFDEVNRILTITVKAENGDTKDYQIEVIKESENINWESIDIVNPDFEDGMNGWKVINLNDGNITSSNGINSSKAINLYNNIIDQNEYACVYQEIEGIHVGDKIKVSCYISTYYNSNGNKNDCFSSIKLYLGNQEVEMDSVSTANSSFILYSATFTVTEAVSSFGIKLLAMRDGYWGYIDSFSLMKGSE